jgi:hypothetical protein
MGVEVATNVGGQRKRTWRDVLLQMGVIAGAAVFYFAVRRLTQGDAHEAAHNARRILNFEDNLGMAVEATLQGHILPVKLLVDVANWVYIWGHWPVIAGMLVWLYVRRPERYRLFLRAVLISGAIGLVMFAWFPVAPPRLLPEAGLQDTVTQLSTSYHVLQSPKLVNRFAAMPSLHVGWNLLVGLVVFGTVRRTAVRVVAVTSPVLMTAAVVLTGNHYILDALAGMIVATVGLAIAARWSKVRINEAGNTLLPADVPAEQPADAFV